MLRCAVDGTLVPVARLGEFDAKRTELRDVGAAAGGGVVAAGTWEVASGQYNFYVGCFDEAGSTRWDHLWDSGEGPDDA